MKRLFTVAFLVGALLLTTSFGWAITPKRDLAPLDQKEFFKPELYISTSHVGLEDVRAQLANRNEWDTFLGKYGLNFQIFLDPRSGTPSNVLGPVPMIPGDGYNNTLTIQDVSNKLGKPVNNVTAKVVGDLVRRFLRENQAAFKIDLSQLGKVRVEKVTDELWHVNFPQVVNGIPVREGRVAATISHGNLVTMGTEGWGNVNLDTNPKITRAQALEIGFKYVGEKQANDLIWKDAGLEIMPVAPSKGQSGEAYVGPVGEGFGHRLVWTYGFERAPELSRWEVIVDAHSGELLAFQDRNHYVNRKINGGVYPLTSTGVCPSAEFCGIMQPDTPMPFANTGLAAPNNFTNSAGVYNYTSGTVTTTLSGRYVRILDSCGAISQSSSTGDILMGGTNNQHDCTTGGGSAGNTPASRSAFYEINKIAELARGWLPTNTWLQNQLTANVNINQTCNGFWNGSTVNFYRSGGGCRNTGELAGVFDHEWGHGMDDNDSGGGLSNSSEGYADIAAIYRYQASCVGYGFFWTLNDGCGQTADGTGFNSNEAQQGAAHCDTNCSGVRDADFARHTPNTPDTPQNYSCVSCLASTGLCGRQVHCTAAPTRQAAWDFVARDLPAAGFNSNTAFMIGNKVFYQGSGNVGAWHACTCPSTSNGCGATNGYMGWLAADDNDGNINNGTPHMTSIFNAFNRHNIACSTPAPVNSGCAGAPTAAPAVTATAGDHQISLSWNSITGAAKYWVLRTEGHAGCNYGKALIASPTGTSFVDTGVVNGRTYYYNVVAVASSNSCFGPAQSTCASATPTGGGGGDTIPPTTSITSPTGGTVSGTITISANAADNVGVTNVEFYVDSGLIGSDASSPYSVSWNTTTVSNGNHTLFTRAFDAAGNMGQSANVVVNVNNPTGGTAVFDPVLQAPKCATLGFSCDTGASLVLGRANLGPEPNQPNTINDSCADGTSGVFHSDESNDRIRVFTTDGTNFAPGKTAQIDATVWAWTTPSADTADFFYAADANAPSWVFIGSRTPTAAGAQTLSITYSIPNGGANQAVRVQFRYQSSTAACAAGAYNDRDDLVFAVTSTPVTTVFFDDFETALGWTTNPNGTDTATTGMWERGDPQDTNSSGIKQLGTTVSVVNDLSTGRLAGAAAGDFDIDSGVTSIQSPLIALPSSGTLTLSFSYYLAHGTNSSTADFFRVFIVGSTTQQVFQELGGTENDNGAWITGSANISSFAGQTVRIRIEAADASTASLVEAGVDDVRITQQ
jgi:Zn-dependent metalloprotease